MEANFAMGAEYHPVDYYLSMFRILMALWKCMLIGEERDALSLFLLPNPYIFFRDRLESSTSLEKGN